MNNETTVQLDVNLGVRAGVIKPLHGVNLGPLQYNGFIDTSARFRELSIPYTRLHDCPYAVPETVDIHSIFPIFDADPQDPGNYRFAITDDYIQSILDTGSRIIYRLGESIEHYTRHKYFVHPPGDYAKWAAICVNIIRHYNEGWADGFHHDIRYWEIWNEPWNQPFCWTGTDTDYFRLYEVAAKTIKAHDPRLSVGGPSVVDSDNPRGFGSAFLEHCRRTGAPVDFYTWHVYTDNPAVIVTEAGKVRDLLARYGFEQAESHLNEWSRTPSDWGDIFKTDCDPAIFRRVAEGIGDEHGAAYDAAALINLQDCPVDVANYYWAMNGLFGFLDQYGAPRKNYYAFRAFRTMLDTPQRVLTTPNNPTTGYALLAGIADTPRAGILLANVHGTASAFTLSIKDWSWPGKAICHCYWLDAEHDLTLVQETTLADQNSAVSLCLPAPSVSLLIVSPTSFP